jgi:quercetin 2,3-dioxygenase
MPKTPTLARPIHHHPSCNKRFPAQQLPHLAVLLLLLLHVLLSSPLVARSFLVAETIHHPARISNKQQAQPQVQQQISFATAAAAAVAGSSSCASLTTTSSSALFATASTSTSTSSSADNAELTQDATAATTTMGITARSHYRSIRRVLGKPHPHWVGDGFKVLPVFANLAFTEQVSPFLMFDYGEPQKFDPQPAGAKPHGVGQHPHRGFETVTIAFQGEVEHHDSVGNRGTIGPGDVQWMTAGRGIVHEEYHSKEFTKKGGTLEMCQLWVNLRAKDKMTPPKYQEILNANIPVVELTGRAAESEDESAAAAEAADGVVGSARVIAGELLGTKGPASTFSPIQVWDVSLPHQGATVELPLPSNQNCVVFVRRGSVQVLTSESGSTNGGGGSSSKKDGVLGPQDVALLDPSGPESSASVVGLRVLEPNTSVLLLGGEPLDEPIVNHGPFVMNTQAQIQEAFVDYRSGRLGR